jgi:hypothetical protein
MEGPVGRSFGRDHDWQHQTGRLSLLGSHWLCARERPKPCDRLRGLFPKQLCFEQIKISQDAPFSIERLVVADQASGKGKHFSGLWNVSNSNASNDFSAVTLSVGEVVKISSNEPPVDTPPLEPTPNEVLPITTASPAAPMVASESQATDAISAANVAAETPAQDETETPQTRPTRATGCAQAESGNALPALFALLLILMLRRKTCR